MPLKICAELAPSVQMAAEPLHLDRWRADFADSCCNAGGVLHLVGAPLYWVFRGAPHAQTPALLLAGLGLLAIPRLPLSVRARSWALVGVSTATLVLVANPVPWALPVVGASCWLVVVTALLLGRGPMLALLALESVAILLASRVLAGRPMDPLVDPRDGSNWVRNTAMLLFIAALIGSVLRRSVARVGETFAAAQQELGAANQALEQSRRAREARIDAERRLRADQKLQAVHQLSGGLAHLLNNALTVVLSALEEARADLSAQARARSTRAINDAIGRVARAVRELMVFSRRSEAVAVLDVTAELRALVGGLTGTLPRDVRVVLSGNQPYLVQIAAPSLRQLVVNLLLNAVAAVRPGGKVQVTLLPPEPQDPAHGTLRLLVEDDGVGMTPDVAARACDAFFTTEDGGQHAGLGLTIAAAIAEQAGGTLQLESARKLGTRVTVRLPLTEAPAKGADPPKPLHGAGALFTSRVSLLPLQPAPSAETEAWKHEIAIFLARWCVLVVPAVVLISSVAGVQIPWVSWLFALLTTSTYALAGFTSSLSASKRATMANVAFAVTSLYYIATSSFASPGAVAAVLAAVAMMTLLGPRWGTPGVLVVTGATMLGAGWLHTHGFLTTPPGVSSNQPEHWRRIAVVAPLVQMLLGFAVYAILGHAVRGTQLAEQAKLQRLAAREEEEAEGLRLLAVEQDATRSARLAATGRAVGSVAHDLANALQVLTAESLELGRATATEAEARDACDAVEHALDYCRAFASQFEMGEEALEPARRAIDLSSCARRTSKMLRLILSKGVQLETRIDDECHVRITESDARRLLFNLVSNARDAIPGDGVIRVTLSRPQPERVELSVSDNGTGMDAATRAHLFEAFFTTKPEGRGTGLGLYSVRQLLDRSGGDIQVESQPGAGSTFRLSWPLAARSRERHSVTEVRHSGHPAQRVLVVEDEPLVREFIARHLRRAGWFVHEAEDGDVGAALIETDHSLTALVVDGVLPGVGSEELIERFLRRHPVGQVVLCSGYLPEELARRGLLRASVAFLPKPFDGDELVAALARGGAAESGAHQLLA